MGIKKMAEAYDEIIDDVAILSRLTEEELRRLGEKDRELIRKREGEKEPFRKGKNQ
jgi:hypothetical protein